jgi:hypothetical protein
LISFKLEFTSGRSGDQVRLGRGSHSFALPSLRKSTLESPLHAQFHPRILQRIISPASVTSTTHRNGTTGVNSRKVALMG